MQVRKQKQLYQFSVEIIIIREKFVRSLLNYSTLEGTQIVYIKLLKRAHSRVNILTSFDFSYTLFEDLLFFFFLLPFRIPVRLTFRSVCKERGKHLSTLIVFERNRASFSSPRHHHELCQSIFVCVYTLSFCKSHHESNISSKIFSLTFIFHILNLKGYSCSLRFLIKPCLLERNKVKDKKEEYVRILYEKAICRYAACEAH